MTLSDWLEQGRLHQHTPSKREIKDLLSVADRDLAQCQIPGLDPDWRLAIAYNAALRCATAALAAAGYRAARDAHHRWVIESLTLTIGWSVEKVDVFNRFRRKRHIAGYERVGVVSEQDADEMLDLARELKAEVLEWLRAKYPSLLPAP